MAGGARERVNILSIQSWVAYGHVGNAAAVFPLQRLGAEVWAVNTVQFSNHTGYGHWTGEVYSGAAVRALVDGIAARGVLRHCDARALRLHGRRRRSARRSWMPSPACAPPIPRAI